MRAGWSAKMRAMSVYRPTADPTEVAAYCWPQSATAGATIEVFGRGPNGIGQLEVARIGAERVVVRRAEIRLAPQELPPEADALGCDWPTVATFTVAPEWPSGYYEVVVRLPDDDRGRGLLRRPRHAADRAQRPLLVLSTNTWNAYNDVAGTNLYTGGTHASFLPAVRAGVPAQAGRAGQPRRRASDAPDPRMRTPRRPHPRPRPVGLVGLGRLAVVGAAVRAVGRGATAIELDYATNADLRVRPDLLDGRRLYLSVGHDEYWSWEMRDAVEGFVAAGGNAAFLSGNVSFWQVRLEDDGRTMVGYKQRFEHDPVLRHRPQDRLTSMWSRPADRPARRTR